MSARVQSEITNKRVPVAGLKPHPRNYNQHDASQVEDLRVSLRTFGQVRSIVVQATKTLGEFLIVAGHGITEAARLEGVKTLKADVIPASWKPARVLAYLAADNELARRGNPDQAQLAAIVAEVQRAEGDVLARLAAGSEAALKELIAAQNGAGDADAEPQIDRAAELNEKWQVKRGDLWRIGEHRLYCGDSTNAGDVALVMQGERAALAPVDPPYNVGFDYDGETVDDDKSAEKYEAFSRAWFGVCQSVSDRQIVTPGCYNLASWLRWFDPYHVAPWTKTAAMTNGKVSRWWCWEPVLFFGAGWNRTRPNDVFHYEAIPQKLATGETLTGIHPCPKPLPMWNDLIENYSDKNAIIFESFAGSGTTLVACQNLQRKCRAIEISPNYCAVILERMATAFPGIEVERLNGHDQEKSKRKPR